MSDMSSADMSQMDARAPATALTLGPILFNWKPEDWRDFYFRIADEAPVATVYLGETICSKRAPLFEPYFADVAQRLTSAGKKVVFSTLGETVLPLDRKLVDSLCAMTDNLIEANDGSALYHLRGRPHTLGPLLNVYNEESLRFLAAKGACNVCVPAEMPEAGIRAMCRAAADIDVSVEVTVFGRLPLALSARCYHARAHGRTKDTCQFVCENDADGLELSTLEGREFLTINGIQTMSYDYLNLIREVRSLKEMGAAYLRLSPHSCDMVKVATVFAGVLAGHIDGAEGAATLVSLDLGAPYSNGFYHAKPGYVLTESSTR
jgi:collagenase-like PrtC family protease